MKAVLDACVLFPTVLREILLGVAGKGLYQPLWSARILEEWARAVVKLGPGAEPVARAEIAALRAAWPGAEVKERPGLERRLWLPDPDDVHVLTTAVVGSADVIITLNAADFPRGVLAAEGIERQAPDAFLTGLHSEAPDSVAAAVAAVADTARRLAREPLPLRPLLKRASLPNLGKRLSRPS